MSVLKIEKLKIVWIGELKINLSKMEYTCIGGAVADFDLQIWMYTMES